MLTSIIRTVTPALVGWVLSWPLVAWLGLTGEQVTWLVVAVLTAAPVAANVLWYVVVRAVEQRWPAVGVLLGRRGAPTYQARHKQA